MRTPRLLSRCALPLAIALLALLTPALRADQAAIRTVLDQMQKAVLAGDGPAYLALVSSRDPIFRKEQENWAADLKLHVPREFELHIVEPEPPAPPAPPAPATPASPAKERDEEAKTPATDAPAPKPANTFGPDRASFTLKTRWAMAPVKPAEGANGGGGGGDAEPPEAPKPRDVSFRVSFAREGDRWLYQGEEWETHERPADPATGFAGVRVRYAPGLKEAAELTAELMPDVRQTVDALFGQPIAHVQEVKLYTSMRHLQHSIYLSYVDGLSGWNEPHEAVKILSRSTPRPRSLRTLLGHEYGHVATFELGSKSTDMAWWILEGIANLCGSASSEGDGRAADRAVIRWRDQKKLAEWSDLADFRSIKPEWMRHVYTQGEHFVRWFTEKHGDKGRTEWLRLMAQGQSLDDATKKVAGITFAEADAAWRKHVAELEVPSRDEE